VTDHFVQTGGDLAKRAMLDGFDQLGEYVFPVHDRIGQTIEGGAGLLRVPFFELFHFGDLAALLR
jgi:hypothetical protein